VRALKNNTPLANPIRFEITRQAVLYNPSPVEIEGSALSWRKPQRKVFRKHDDLTQNINSNGFPAAGQSRQPDAERLGHHEQDHRKPETAPDVVELHVLIHR
jgi:hypothetical protein